MDIKVKEILNIVFNTIIVICGLTIVGLLGINTFLKFSGKFSESQKVVVINESEQTEYQLPEPIKIKSFEDIKNKRIRGFPIAIEFATIVKVGGHKMLFFPLIMSEPQLYDKIQFGLVDPNKWGNPHSFYDYSIGRRSMWFMPINSLMLYGILLDPQLKFDRVGVGYVLVKRLEESIYDVILQDNHGVILYAARGKLKKLNERIGQGTLIPLKNQEAVRKIYSAKWDIDPTEFILFCPACSPF